MCNPLKDRPSTGGGRMPLCLCVPYGAIMVALMLTLALAAFFPPAARAADVRPCDIYAAGKSPCVAAHSTTRALYAAYSGRLYQVQRASDNATMDIGTLAPGGYANASAQDAFCANTRCAITVLYDQSAQHNDLTIEGPGSNGGQDHAAPADGLPVTLAGHPVYGISFSGQMGYRKNDTTGVAKNGQPEGAYMVTSGTHVNDQCCFDYGNMEASNNDTGNGHMDAINFGTECWFGVCPGPGPWVQADLENGLFMSNRGVSTTQKDRSRPEPFVTAILKNNGQNFFALKSGNAQSGLLRVEYAGGEPVFGGYSPMHQEGGIGLGTGGDNSNGSIGSFFEGAMTAGLPTDATENAVQANIVAAGYTMATGAYGALTPGSEVSILTDASNSYLFHRVNDGAQPVLANAQSIIANNVTAASSLADRQAATFIVRRGLAQNNCVSFESRDRPGEFIRHYSFVLYLMQFDGSANNAADATFCPVSPLAGSTAQVQTVSTTVQAVMGQPASLQSFNFPDRYMRVYLQTGYIAAASGNARAQDGGTTFKNDATFTITAPLAP